MVVVYVRDLRLETVIGVYERERRHPQPLEFDIEMGMQDVKACHTDQLGDTINYVAVIEEIHAILANHSFRLLEPLAHAIAEMIIDKFGAEWVRLEVTKAGIVPSARSVGVRIERSKSK